MLLVAVVLDRRFDATSFVVLRCLERGNGSRFEAIASNGIVRHEMRWKLVRAMRMDLSTLKMTIIALTDIRVRVLCYL